MTSCENQDDKKVELSKSMEDTDYETSFPSLIPDPLMREKDRKFLEIIAYLGIFTMENYIRDRMTANSLQLDDLYLLQSLGDEDLDYEIEKTRKHSEKLDSDFCLMYRFCEHLAKTYLHCDSKLMSALITRVPIDDDIDDDLERLLMNDFLCMCHHSDKCTVHSDNIDCSQF